MLILMMMIVYCHKLVIKFTRNVKLQIRLVFKKDICIILHGRHFSKDWVANHDYLMTEMTYSPFLI